MLSHYQKLHKTIVDKIGISASLICLVHCITLPYLLLIFPALNGFSVWSTHLLLGTFVLLSALVAATRGYKRHAQVLPVFLVLAGALMIIATFMLPDLHPNEQHATKIDSHVLLTMLGSIVLISGHIINMKSCHCCKSNPEHAHYSDQSSKALST